MSADKLSAIVFLKFDFTGIPGQNVSHEKREGKMKDKGE